MSKMKDLLIDETNKSPQRPLSDDSDDYTARLEEFCDELEFQNNLIFKRNQNLLDLKLFNAIKMALIGFEVFGAIVSTIHLENGDTLKLELLKKKEEKENVLQDPR